MLIRRISPKYAFGEDFISFRLNCGRYALFEEAILFLSFKVLPNKLVNQKIISSIIRTYYLDVMLTNSFVPVECFLRVPGISVDLQNMSGRMEDFCFSSDTTLTLWLSETFEFPELRTRHIFRHTSVSSTYPCKLVHWLVGHTFGFPISGQ